MPLIQVSVESIVKKKLSILKFLILFIFVFQGSDCFKFNFVFKCNWGFYFKQPSHCFVFSSVHNDWLIDCPLSTFDEKGRNLFRPKVLFSLWLWINFSSFFVSHFRQDKFSIIKWKNWLNIFYSFCTNSCGIFLKCWFKIASRKSRKTD